MKLVYIRGLPGSGKDFLAEKINKNNEYKIVSADQFFIKDNKYQWCGNLISHAHKWCLGMIAYYLFREQSVIITNTGTQAWEIVPAIDLAFNLKVQWEILEPTTKWRYNVQECAKRNTHNVPESTIQKMMDRFEKTSDLLKQFDKYRGAQ